jgi:hypothetical protein
MPVKQVSRPTQFADGEDSDTEVAGWESLGQVLLGVSAESVDSLRSARDLEIVFPLLHALTRGSLRDFFVRVAALEAIVAENKSRLTGEELKQALYWLTDDAREMTLRRFRMSSIISYEATSSTYSLTQLGQFVVTMLGFLRANSQQLHSTVEGVDYMIRLGVSPLRHLLSLRAQLESLQTDMLAARESKSETILRKEAGRLAEALALSERIRAVLEGLPKDSSESLSVAREVHDLLSRLHTVGSDLHAAITEVGRQYLNPVAGLTTADIFGVLMRMASSELAALTARALRPVIQAPPLIESRRVTFAAELHMLKHREPDAETVWDNAPMAAEGTANTMTSEETERLLAELDQIVADKGTREFHDLVPSGDYAESFLRASLLPLVGVKVGGEGAAGRLGALPIDVLANGGPPTSCSAPLKELTPGRVQARDAKHG